MRDPIGFPGGRNLTIALLEYQWGPYPVQEDGLVNSGDWLGWLGVDYAPWIWSYSLNGWIYSPREPETSSGAWLFVPNY